VCVCVCVQHKRQRIKSVSDDDDEEQVAETGQELIANEIFGDDDDEGSVIQSQTAGVGSTAAGQTEFDLEQSDEESGLMILLCLHTLPVYKAFPFTSHSGICWLASGRAFCHNIYASETPKNTVFLRATVVPSMTRINTPSKSSFC